MKGLLDEFLPNYDENMGQIDFKGAEKAINTLT